MQGLLLYLLVLGSVGFGGPIALVARMERDLVEKRAWFTLEEFRAGVALAQLAPGPLAAQLAMYLAWLRGGWLGSLAGAVAFVLPSFLIVVALGWWYSTGAGGTLLQRLFYGFGAVVIAVLARSAYRLVRRTVGRDVLLIGVAAANAVAVVGLGRESIPFLFVTGAIPFVWARRSRFTAGAPVLLPFLPPSFTVAAPTVTTLGDIVLFFAKSSLVVFGSGLAIVPFLHAEVVGMRGWLTEVQFLDAIAVAMLTPGPVVITVAFIGWLVAGLGGAAAAALGVFLPTWLVVVLAAPAYARLSRSATIRLLAQGVTAAATGGLVGAVVLIAARSLVDLPAALLAVAAMVVLAAWPRLPEPVVLAIGGVLGLVVSAGR
ncbi:MAG: chromate efflux transporter [Gemmatimonadales bacterium]